MTSSFSIRFSRSADEMKGFNTSQFRENFLVDGIFRPDHISVTYSMQDRFVIGGAQPVGEALAMPAFEDLTKASFFLERREMGIINVGGPGMVSVDGVAFPMGFKDALYVGKGTRELIFRSDSGAEPAKFYFNSVGAHAVYPPALIPHQTVAPVELGEHATANRRNIYQYIVTSRVQTCQLVMGLTELISPSTWNTFPPHTHYRRNEVYFYFNLADDQLVVHLMGEPAETRHLIMRNDQAAISPEWSIHSGVGTNAYTFIWGMGGENQEYTDMDKVEPKQLL
ncbi:MAG: 5-dehydro-4-deoxy-D-glucuronate isomerase [Haliscomenobacter sp.]|nr:5-dehydro-4-deoxy-D-glucuronate isomerase [Haliscomenobacter sp.]